MLRTELAVAVEFVQMVWVWQEPEIPEREPGELMANKIDDMR